MRIVKSANNSIAAGGDITIYIVNDGFDIGLLAKAIGVDAVSSVLSNSFISDGKSIYTERAGFILDQLIVQDLLRSSKLHSKYMEIDSELTKRIQDISQVRAVVKEVYLLINGHKYSEAHSYLKLLRSRNLLHEKLRTELFEDYVLTGYIHYANSGDLLGLSKLVNECSKNLHRRSLFMKYILLKMHQEKATRLIPTTELTKNIKKLSIFLRSSSLADDERLKVNNLLALGRRRIGERGNKKQLLKSAEMYISLLREENLSLEGEIRNNYGMTLIRLFEVTNSATYLDEAERQLRAVDKNIQNKEIEEYFAIPKSLNSLGNVYRARQRLGTSRDFKQAISFYTQAEVIWTENTAPYEWAMVQKNKARTRLIAFESGHIKREDLEIGREEMNASLLYRRPDNAPYQHRQAAKIRSEIERALS